MGFFSVGRRGQKGASLCHIHFIYSNPITHLIARTAPSSPFHTIHIYIKRTSTPAYTRKHGRAAAGIRTHQQTNHTHDTDRPTGEPHPNTQPTHDLWEIEGAVTIPCIAAHVATRPPGSASDAAEDVYYLREPPYVSLEKQMGGRASANSRAIAREGRSRQFIPRRRPASRCSRSSATP